MDSHHDMVMRERERAQDAPPVRYFAYSTILDRAAFLEWRDQHEYQSFDLPAGQLAEAKDVALVYDFPSRWWGGRAAGLEDRAGAHVYGLVFEIAGRDWPIVRHKEGAITNMAIERKVRVRLAASGEEIEAVAFATRPERRNSDGPVSERFVEALVRGARSAGLPEAWIAELSTPK
jgi:gamma-glutamylcyclotransferase